MDLPYAAYHIPSKREKSQLMHTIEQRSGDAAPPAYHHDSKLGFNPYPSPPATTPLCTSGASGSLPIALHQQSPTGQQPFFSHPILIPQSTAPSHLPPPPNSPLPPAPSLSDVGFPQMSPESPSLHQRQQSFSSPLSTFPAPPQHSAKYHSQPYQAQAHYSSQSHLPNSPSSPTSPSFHAMQGTSSQNIDTAYNLHASLSSLSLAPSPTSTSRPELTRVVSNGSGSPILQRPASVASRHSMPAVKASVMDIRTAEALASLTFETMPRCYVVAPPASSVPSSSAYPTFRILAPCQALGVRNQKENPLHFPDHPGYMVNNPEEIMKTHGTVLQHFANMACLVSGATEPSLGKGLGKFADRFLKTVKQVTPVPLTRDTMEMGTGIDTTSLQIEKFMVEHLQVESIAKMMRDITGSKMASDWSGGLQRIISPGTGRAMWVCSDCFSGLQSGKYEWNDEQASLDDLVGYPDKSGVKSEANVLNAVAMDVYSQMIKGQSRIKHAIINISPAYFEHPDRRDAAIFLANQKLIQNFTKVIAEAHLTMVELNANQARDSELMDKDNIYLHVRRLFVCYQLEYVKLSGLPYLLREKLPGFLNHARFLSFDGVLVDNDKAVANMKKLITENSDMEHLVLTRAQMTSTGLKVLCSAHKNLRRLTKLDLSHNRLDAEGIKELASQVLPTSLDLKFLDLCDNPNIGTAGCISLLNGIWPPSSHATRQKRMVSLQLANTGFCDDAAKLLSKNLDNPHGIGALYNLNLSGNQISKPGLLSIMNCVAQHGTTTTLRKIFLSQHITANILPTSLDNESVHLLGVHPTLTHLSLSKLSLSMTAQIVNVSTSLLSLVVDDVMCVSQQDANYPLSSFNSLCQSIASNTTIQDLKIRLPLSFWGLAYQATNASEQETQLINASGWMAVMEDSVKRNTTLRCFQMRGVTNFEDELLLATAMSSLVLSGAASIAGGPMGRYGGISGIGAGEIARTEVENKMVILSQSIRMYLERNQVMNYARKHDLEEQLIGQY